MKKIIAFLLFLLMVGCAGKTPNKIEAEPQKRFEVVSTETTESIVNSKKNTIVQNVLKDTKTGVLYLQSIHEFNPVDGPNSISTVLLVDKDGKPLTK